MLTLACKMRERNTLCLTRRALFLTNSKVMHLDPCSYQFVHANVRKGRSPMGNVHFRKGRSPMGIVYANDTWDKV
jgi:hypothetical protein